MRMKKPSALYRHIETLQGDRPWGHVLDAGTGQNSLRWLSRLETERWTAVTGSSREAEQAGAALGSTARAVDRVLVGNWADDGLLKGEMFDTIIADYLLGALEGLAPFFQPYLFARLRPHARGALYVTGLEPYVPTERPAASGAAMIWEIGRFRDACVLLKGGLPYREYPSAWVADHMARAGFTVSAVKHFGIGYKNLFIDAQLEIALHDLDAHIDAATASALKTRAETLRENAYQIIETEGALRGCRNYVISAAVGQ